MLAWKVQVEELDHAQQDVKRLQKAGQGGGGSTYYSTRSAEHVEIEIDFSYPEMAVGGGQFGRGSERKPKRARRTKGHGPRAGQSFQGRHEATMIVSSMLPCVAMGLPWVGRDLPRWTPNIAGAG